MFRRQAARGAPANFAYMTRLLGDEVSSPVRVGTDALGRAAGRRLERLGLRATHLHLIPRIHGTVKVAVDPTGQPPFEIAESVAWISFEWTPEMGAPWRNARMAFASVARPTLPALSRHDRAFLARSAPMHARSRRQSAAALQWETLSESVKLAHRESNREELPVSPNFGHPFIYDEARGGSLLRDTLIEAGVHQPRGPKGSLVVGEDETSEHPGFAGMSRTRWAPATLSPPRSLPLSTATHPFLL